MAIDVSPNQFHSVFKTQLVRFVSEKQATGYKYKTGSVYLRDFDRFLTQTWQDAEGLPKHVVDRWTTKRPNESENTHYNRASILRQFSAFLCRQGIPAYVPPPDTGRHNAYGFEPRIFTREEIQRIFAELDSWPSSHQFPLRNVVMAEIFRTLYGCGLRLGEALNLRLRDVDLVEGILTIRHAKCDKDRLVPVAPHLLVRLKAFAEHLGVRNPDAYFFPGPDGQRVTHGCVYKLFRNILWKIGIPHVGRNHGPRVHDLRHAFAVHRLLQWYEEGVDLNAMMPRLSMYLGHSGMAGTQRYLHMIPALLSQITKRMEERFNYVIPGGAQ